MYDKRILPGAAGRPVTVATALGDVTGDGLPDRVSLTGYQTAGSPFVQGIVLHVRSTRTGKTTRVPLKQDAGYSPTLFLGDFTGDGVKDILVRINSGGSGAITYDMVYTFAGGAPDLIFDSEAYNRKYQYTVDYRDGALVEVVSRQNRMRYYISLLTKGDAYLREIYDREGRLKRPIQGVVNPLSGLFPIDVDGDGVYELLAYQQIAGQYQADGLGYVQNILQWRKNTFALWQQTVGIFGGELDATKPRMEETEE